METPDFPLDETQRLESLHAIGILDSDAEDRFDRLTRLASRLFGVQISLVSLIDENRQWFKSKVGLDVREMGRDISFCGHAILGDQVFVIEDTLEDPRFHDNPLVTEPPNIRFYAGAPLKLQDGHRLGTLCLVDPQPRKFSDDDRKTLGDLARMAENELGAIRLATLDELTRIANRRGFIALAQNLLNLCARQRMPVSLAFFDLDGFKQVNDRFGHSEGDRALASFANLMREAFRDSDVFGRLGGDEFVVLLTNADERKATEILDRFANLVEVFNKRAQRGYAIEFSDGFVSVETDADTNIEALLKSADAVMYRNKHASPNPMNLACQT